MGLNDGIQGITDGIDAFIDNNTAAVVGGAAAIGVASGIGIGALIGSSSNGSKRRKRTHTKRGWKQDRKRFNKSQKWEVAYRKRKRKAKHSKRSRSKKGIHYTKKGQPYKILANGRARFIKK